MSDRGEGLAQQRLAKLERLRDRGIEPYPPRYRRTHTNQEAVALFTEQAKEEANIGEVSVAGRITSSRDMGKATFLDLRDGSGKIQLYLRSDQVSKEIYDLLKDIDLGDFIGARGKLFRTRTGEVTVHVHEIVLLAKSLRPPPEKWHGLIDVEKRYRQRYLDLISSEEVRNIFRVRSRVIAAIRHFLDERDFMEVETPILLPVAAGAMAKPFITHHEALDQDLYLRIATELHLKRLIIGGIDKVYEIGRVFRNEGISTKHNPEFTTLESYEAYADYNDVMTMVENMVAHIAHEVAGTLKMPLGEDVIDFTPPWRRAYLRDEIKAKSGIDFEDYQDADSLKRAMQDKGIEVEPNASRGRLIDKLLSTFVEPTLIQPTFLMDYPVDMSPLAKRKADNPRFVERFEGFAGGMEIANAFTELNDPLDQQERFMEQERLRSQLGDEETERMDEDFLVALEHGMPPTGGLGMGVDRLVMLLTNQKSIREVILFPQLRSR
ncbi:MAG: lysine--tRNA ligase [Chloroflexi bacterium]|nr:lysine--tRNA ligase [Chloroflexota bacterium]